MRKLPAEVEGGALDGGGPFSMLCIMAGFGNGLPSHPDERACFLGG